MLELAPAAHEHDIDLVATSNVFLLGHRLRLLVTSSSFPRFDRNPNTGTTVATETELRTADQTIFHDAERPSCLLAVVDAP